MIFRKRNGMKRLLAYCRALFCLGVAGIPLTTMDGPTGGAVDSGQDVAAFTDSSSQELPKPVLDQSFFTAGNLTVTSDAPGTYKIACPLES